MNFSSNTTPNRYGLLIDMDGVIYRGGEVIPGAVEFINGLVEQNLSLIHI